MKIPRILSFILLCSLTMNSVNAKLVFVTEENAINTDNFIINADDSSSDFVDLEFGSALGAKMRYDILNDEFVLNRDLSVSGKIGIHTTSPSADLHIKGDARIRLQQDASGGNAQAKFDLNAGGDGKFYIEDKNSGSAPFVIDKNGNIGVGDTTPDAKLDIAGDLRLDGAFKDKDGDTGSMGQILSSTISGTDWINNSNSIPFISTSTIQQMPNSSTATLNFAGFNFQPNSIVSIPGFDGTINSTTIISPTNFEINVTSGVASNTYNIVISNNGIENTQWTNNGNNLLQVFIGNGTSQANSGESCKSILDNGYSTGDGTYWINPDGGSTSNAFQVYCDMTTSGGGWTKIEYTTDFPHANHSNVGDNTDRSEWWNGIFNLTLTNQQINDIRNVSTEGKQTYVGTCDGVINYDYNNGTFAYAFGFRYHTGHETAYEQQTYPSTNITVTQDGCKTNNNSSTDTIFEINDIRVPVITVHSRDNGQASEKFGSPLTQNPAWLR